MLRLMAQRALTITPLLVRLASALSLEERASLAEASREPGFSEQLRGILVGLDLWTPEGQPSLVALAEQNAPRGESLDLPGYLASLSAEELLDLRASMVEERRRHEAHVAAGSSPESYDPSKDR